MPLKTFKRGKYWYIRGTIGGVEIYETTGCQSESEAESYRLDYEIALRSEHARVKSGKKTFSEALNLYLANGGDKTHADSIREALGHYYLDEINQLVIDESARRMYPTQSNASIKRWFYTPVVSVLRHAAKRQLCGMPIIEKPKVESPPPKWAEPEWFEAFWPHCSPQLKALTTFLLYTGCRITEALNLRWEDINFKEASTFIPYTKTNTPRTVHLRDVVLETLEFIKPKKAVGKIFPWKTKDGAGQAIRRAVARCNKARAAEGLDPIPMLSSHQLGSHTYATWMRRYGGLDQRGLVGTGRWKSIQSTMIYTHTIASEEAKKADFLPVPRAKNVQ